VEFVIQTASDYPLIMKHDAIPMFSPVKAEAFTDILLPWPIYELWGGYNRQVG
jgi:hypothetical protein